MRIFAGLNGLSGQVKGEMKFEKEKIEAFAEAIQAAERVIIVGHFNPDGDAVGSTTALYRYLEAMGKNCCIIFPNEYPLSLQPFLQDTEHLIVSNAEKSVRGVLKEAQLLICADFGRYNRTCEAIEDILRQMSCPKILIDHHEDPEEIGIMFSDPEASSTCELVFKVLSACNEKYLTKECLESIYAGICTDTGSFSHSCRRKDVFDVVGQLVERGVDVSAIKRQVVDLASENRLRLLGYLLNEKMKVYPEQGAAYIWVTKKELRSYDFQKGDLEGVVNYMLRIEGVRFAALLSERKETIRMSFRSLSHKVDVNRFAERYWNGGGHIQAAGGTSSLGMELTCRRLEEQIKKRLYDKSK